MGNHYDYVNPVTNPFMFMGRDQELADLLKGLRDGKSFALIGGSRSGKTSLLYTMKRVLLEELDRDASCVVGPIFLSTQELPRLSPAIIYRQIIHKFKIEICRTKKPNWDVDAGPLFDGKITDEQAPAVFQEILKELLDRVSPDLRIVVLLDEVDVLQEYDWSRMFFLNLRHLISQSELRGHVALLLAGTVAINALYKVAGSPFLNVIKGVRTIVPLADEDAIALIQRPTGNRVRQGARDAILRQTGGHPFLIQYLMEHLCDEFGVKIEDATAADVSRYVEQFFEERRDFDYWSKDFGEVERTVYRLIAKAGRPVEKAEVLGIAPDARQCNHALELLVHLGVIRLLNRTLYSLGGEMFKTWFLENLGPGAATPARQQTPAPAREMREVVRIVLASPGDVKTEREFTAQVIEKLNRGVAREHGCHLDLYRWETDTHPGFHAQGAQGSVDEGLDIDNCDVLIGVFWFRFGTPTADAASGTEHEIRKAIRSWKASNRPDIMLYFSQKAGMPGNSKAAEQLTQVLKFREEMGAHGLLGQYREENEFKEQLDSHLANYIRKKFGVQRGGSANR